MAVKSYDLMIFPNNSSLFECEYWKLANVNWILSDSLHFDCDCNENPNKWKTQLISISYGFDLNSVWVKFPICYAYVRVHIVYPYIVFIWHRQEAFVFLWCTSMWMLCVDFGEYGSLTFIVVSISNCERL